MGGEMETGSVRGNMLLESPILYTLQSLSHEHRVYVCIANVYV